MKKIESLAPAAAVVAALGTLMCCLPVAFLGAAGLAELSLWSARLHWWLLGSALVLLAAGFAQMYGRRSCKTRGRASRMMLWIALGIVAAVILFPQWLATLLAR